SSAAKCQLIGGNRYPPWYSAVVVSRNSRRLPHSTAIVSPGSSPRERSPFRQRLVRRSKSCQVISPAASTIATSSPRSAANRAGSSATLVAEHPPQDLSRRRLGDAVDELDEAHLLVAGDVPGDVRLDLLLGQLGARHRNDERLRELAGLV